MPIANSTHRHGTCVRGVRGCCLDARPFIRNGDVLVGRPRLGERVSLYIFSCQLRSGMQLPNRASVMCVLTCARDAGGAAVHSRNGRMAAETTYTC